MPKSDDGRILPNGKSLACARQDVWAKVTEPQRLAILKNMKDMIREHGITQEQAEDVAYGNRSLGAVRSRRRSPVGSAHGGMPWNMGGKERMSGARSEFELLWKSLKVRVPKDQQKKMFKPLVYELLLEIRKNPILQMRFYSHMIGILAAEHRAKMNLNQDPDADRETLMEILDDAKVSRKSESGGG